jgi:hypothetical protein
LGALAALAPLLRLIAVERGARIKLPQHKCPSQIQDKCPAHVTQVSIRAVSIAATYANVQSTGRERRIFPLVMKTAALVAALVAKYL